LWRLTKTGEDQIRWDPVYRGPQDYVIIRLEQGRVVTLQTMKSLRTTAADQIQAHPSFLYRIAGQDPCGRRHVCWCGEKGQINNCRSERITAMKSWKQEQEQL
jgi:hypothetical protein